MFSEFDFGNLTSTEYLKKIDRSKWLKIFKKVLQIVECMFKTIYKPLD